MLSSVGLLTGMLKSITGNIVSKGINLSALDGFASFQCQKKIHRNWFGLFGCGRNYEVIKTAQGHLFQKTSSMLRLSKIGIVVLIAYIAAQFVNRSASLPPHLLNHKLLVIPELIPEDVSTTAIQIFQLTISKSADKLLQLVKDMKDFPSNAADLKFYKTKHEHIGEAQPAVNGACEHPFLVWRLID